MKNLRTIRLAAIAAMISGWLVVATPAAEPLPRRLSSLELLQGAANNLAKELCSCLFVMKKPEAFCRIYTHQNDYARPVIDRRAKKVYTTIVKIPVSSYEIPVPSYRGYGLDPQTAIYRGPRLGCVLVKK